MTEPGRFAFVLHPLRVEDFARKFGVLRRAPGPLLEWVARFVPPLVASRITGIRSPTGATAEGWFIGLPLTTRVLLASPPEFVYRRLAQCGALAERLGAGIMGLAAFTKVVGDGGVTVAERVRIGVTTGNAYTAGTAVEAAWLAAERLGRGPAQAHVVVVGATGAIGAAVSRLVAPQAARLTLVARTPDRLEALAADLRKTARDVATAADPRRAVRDGDIVFTVTSATEPLIEPEDLRPGAVVCDVARPRNVSRLVYERRGDVLVIDGGVIEVPGEPDFGLDFGLPPRMVEACMAETMILALERRYADYTVGRAISVAQVEEILALGRRHGFRVAGFRRFERAIPDEEVERIRTRAARASGVVG